MGLRFDFSKRLEHFTLKLDLCCPSGRVVSVVGPSGSGKTTLMRILAGLERPDAGRVIHNGAPWFDSELKAFVKPQHRRVGYVFQEYTLFPHLTLMENVCFSAESRELAEDHLRRFSIWHLRGKRPDTLSGGERQRGALAQAMARRPSALLLDEPFSALDYATRRALHEQVGEVVEQLEIPVVLVTHDLDEARRLGHRILPLSQGRLDPAWLPPELAAQARCAA